MMIEFPELPKEFFHLAPWAVLLLLSSWLLIKQSIAERKANRLAEECRLWEDLFHAAKKQAGIRHPGEAFAAFFTEDAYRLSKKEFKRVRARLID